MKNNLNKRISFCFKLLSSTSIISENFTGSIEFSDGTKKWYLNGKRHRENGPAIEYLSGTKCWFLNDECHRTDGPAFEYTNETKIWCLNGEYHRTDGPAIEWYNGGKFWYLKGKKYSEEDWKKEVKKLNSKNK